MTKISKKILLILILVFTLILFPSCNNNVETFENGVDVHISDELKPYMLYPEQLPSLHFDYNGVKCYVENGGSSIYFVKNDQLELSNKFKEHLEQYNIVDSDSLVDQRVFIVSCEDQTIDYETALFNGEKLLLDAKDPDGNTQEYSKEYQTVNIASDGTRYSYQYRKFYSDGEVYYNFRYSSNMGIALEQSLMVVKYNNENKIVLVPLPYDVKYEVSYTNTKLKNLIEKDTYLDEKYYKFAYSDMFNEYDEDDRESLVKAWYTKYCNYDDNTELLTYCGATFKLSFGYTDCGKDQNKPGFKLEFVK